MKLTLPEKVLDETDDIINRALNVDIKQQLNLYEVEYQLLKEEMIDIRQNKEKLEKQEVAHKELENEVVALRNELQEARKQIDTLKSALEQSNQEKSDNQTKMGMLQAERDRLKLSLNEVNSIAGSSIVSPRSEEVRRIMGRSMNHVDGSNEKSWELVPSPDTITTEMNRIMDRVQSIDGTISPSDASETSDDLNKNGECGSLSSECIKNGDCEDTDSCQSSHSQDS